MLNPKNKTFLVIAILFILAIAGYFIWLRPTSQTPSPSTPETAPITNSSVSTISVPVVDELLQNELNEGQQITVAGVFRRICKHPNSGCIDRLFGDEKFFVLDIDDSIIPKEKSSIPQQDTVMTISGIVTTGYCSYIKEDVNKFKNCGLKNVSIVATKPIDLGYRVLGIESGGYSGTAFCSVLNRSDYTIQTGSITIKENGPYTIKINLMKNTFSPNEYPNIQLITHIRFEDKDVSYADTLYFGNDGNLYKCHGGK